MAVDTNPVTGRLIYQIDLHSNHVRTWLAVVVQIGRGNKPAFWLDAGFHAREWVSHSTALYIISKVGDINREGGGGGPGGSNPTYSSGASAN